MLMGPGCVASPRVSASSKQMWKNTPSQSAAQKGAGWVHAAVHAVPGVEHPYPRKNKGGKIKGCPEIFHHLKFFIAYCP